MRELRYSSAAANAPLMGGRVIRIFVVIAMLFGSMLSPAIAHAAGPDVTHMFESSHAETGLDHAGIPNDQDLDGAGGGEGDVVPHHHCIAGLALIVPDAIFEVMAEPLSMFRPQLVASLVSWQSAPPTEPPAA